MEKMNKKGFVLELVAIIVIGFVALLFLAGWKYGINLVNEQLLTVENEAGANITEAAENSFNYMNQGMDYLGLIGFMILFGYAIATLIVAYFSKEHPVMFIIFVFVTILLVIFSIYVSNAYEELLTNETIGTVLTSFSIAKVVMSYLPVWIGVIGLLGCIFMLSGIIKDREFGG